MATNELKKLYSGKTLPQQRRLSFGFIAMGILLLTVGFGSIVVYAFGINPLAMALAFMVIMAGGVIASVGFAALKLLRIGKLDTWLENPWMDRRSWNEQLKSSN